MVSSRTIPSFFSSSRTGSYFLDIEREDRGAYFAFKDEFDRYCRGTPVVLAIDVHIPEHRNLR